LPMTLNDSMPLGIIAILYYDDVGEAPEAA
jgi:hypothetical protein